MRFFCKHKLIYNFNSIYIYFIYLRSIIVKIKKRRNFQEARVVTLAFTINKGKNALAWVYRPFS